MALGNSFSAESRVLLDLLANALFDAKIDIDLAGIDLEQLFAEAKAQTVLALAFDALPSEERKLDAEVYERWKFLAVSMICRNLKQMHQNAELQTIFDEAKLPFCTIKGFASGYYYGKKKHLRQMGDIDFLVSEEKLLDSEKLLLEHEFMRKEETAEHEFHMAFQKNHEVYEMHKGVTSIADNSGDIQKYIAEVFSKAQKVDFDDVQITIPDAFSHGLIMLLHMKRHMLTGGGVGVRHLCDWAVFADSFENEEWVTIFEEKLKKIGLWKFAQYLSKASNVYLKIKEKDWFSGAKWEIAEKLLMDMMISGNFGEVDIKRIQELSFLSRAGKDNHKVIFYAKEIINKVYIWKPFYKKRKWLLPAGIVAYVCRVFYFSLFQKEKLNVFAVHKSGKERNDLYQTLFR